MKLLHLGDLHLGKTVNEFSMIEDQKYILGQVISCIESNKIDALMIAGDVYDKSIPSEEAVMLLDDFLCQLADRKVTVFMISGNHDSDERLNFASNLLASKDIHIGAIYDGRIKKVTMTDAYGPVNFYLLPFVKGSHVKHYYQDEDIVDYESAVRCALSHTEINTSERNVILSHQFVTGNKDPETAGSENIATINVGTIERISGACYKDFDYVALGHIHSPQAIGRETVRYSGSPLKYSLSEVNNHKSMPMITLGPKGDITVDLLPLTPLRDMRHLRGPITELLKKEHVENPDDYIYMTLTDRDVITDAMARIQQIYPNTMKVDYDNERTKSAGSVDFSEVGVAGKSFTELISDYFLSQMKIEIDEEQLFILKEAAREAGVIDEAD